MKRLATVALLVWATSACEPPHASGSVPTHGQTPDVTTQAYVALIRSFWADLHVADVGADGSDVDAKACPGELSPKSPSDAEVVVPRVCHAYASASLTANEKFLAELDGIGVPAKFARDDQVFRSRIPAAIGDLKTLMAACDAPKSQSIIDTMWRYAEDMIPAVTDALDDVDPSVVHLDPSSTA